MDGDLQAELRELQARAYGPGGGLGDDPVARRRLNELESRARAEQRHPRIVDQVPAPTRTAAVSPAAPMQLPPAPTVPAAVAATARAAQRSAAPPSGGSRKRRLLTGIAWAGSLAMVATVAVGITAAASARVSGAGAPTTSGAAITHVTTLSLDPDRAWPEVLSAPPSDGRIYAALAGMTPIVAQYDTGYGDKAQCIQVLPDEAWSASPEDGWSGAWYTSCAAEPFAPAASVIVSDETPAELRERFPEGTRLQFVLGDGVVEVYSADAPTGEATG